MPAIDAQEQAPLGTGWETRRYRQDHLLGMRATRWRADNWGLATELTQTGIGHIGVTSDSPIIADGFGPVLLTLTAMRRFLVEPRVQAYGGAGLGTVVVLNHDLGGVEVPLPQQDGTSAARVIAGASYAIDARWSVFGEYVATYYWHGQAGETAVPDAELLTHSLNFGIGFSF